MWELTLFFRWYVTSNSLKCHWILSYLVRILQSSAPVLGTIVTKHNWLWGSIIPWKAIVSQLVKKFPAFIWKLNALSFSQQPCHFLPNQVNTVQASSSHYFNSTTTQHCENYSKELLCYRWHTHAATYCVTIQTQQTQISGRNSNGT
jgi:hypothetical protein